MKLLWTKSNNIGSRLIQWGTGGDCSHFAVCFDDRPGGYGLVFHSSMVGANLDFLGSFQGNHQIVHCLEPSQELDEEKIYLALVSRFNHKPYDKLAYLYFALRVLGLKLFRIPLPSRNIWGNKDFLLCTEMGQALKDAGVPHMPDIQDYGMISPPSLFINFTVDPFWRNTLAL